MGMNVTERRPGNFILDSLPKDEYEVLHPHLQLVELNQNDVLVGLREPIKQVYFPTTALVAWVNSTSEGETVEIGATGFEGMVGTPLVLGQETTPWEVIVIISGAGYRLSAETFVQLLPECPALYQKLMAFTYLKIVQLTQSALCNRFHALEQRLCRWLLASNDRVKTPELMLTRETLAMMIGAHRPAVSVVTGVLQTAGLIRTFRGRVILLNREEMAEATCECYHVVKQAFDSYLLRESNHD